METERDSYTNIKLTHKTRHDHPPPQQRPPPELLAQYKKICGIYEKLKDLVSHDPEGRVNRDLFLELLKAYRKLADFFEKLPDIVVFPAGWEKDVQVAVVQELYEGAVGCLEKADGMEGSWTV
jgi:hypothetical protein